ncbi:MAG: hypothetical protein DRP84_02135 [Spirochaetes bacterium]|nr:MAG: hypothetical protein DRP84_02135 [Spirochaetota bacterium]
MKILLVFPRFRYISGQPPLGIASIYSYLKSKWPKIDVTVFDNTFVRNKRKGFENFIKENSFDVVGFSVMNTFISDVRSLAAIVRQYLPKAKILMGGPQVTVDSEYFLKLNLADVIILGEGEVTFSELVEKGCEPSGVKGTVYRKADEIIYEEAREMLEDLDELPITDRSIFDMDSYVKLWNNMDVVSNRLKGTSVMVSRGCPYQCSFCQPTLQKIFGKSVRKYSAERVIEELEYLKEKYFLNAFVFEDDILMIEKKWVSKICDLMLERNLGMVWGCNIRADLCDYDVLKKMHGAGLRTINIGIESASQHILDEVFKKGIKIEQVIDSVNMAKQLGLYVQGYFMLGHPRESKTDIKKTIKFARQLDIDEAAFNITTPLPGTRLFDNDKNFIEKGCDNYDYYSRSVYKREALQTARWMIYLYKQYAYFRFYSRPKLFVKQMENIFSKNGFMKFIYKLERILT